MESIALTPSWSLREEEEERYGRVGEEEVEEEGSGRKQLPEHWGLLVPLRGYSAPHERVGRRTETDLCDFKTMTVRLPSLADEAQVQLSVSLPGYKCQLWCFTSLSLWSLSTAVSFSFRLDTSVISSSFWVSSAVRFTSSCAVRRTLGKAGKPGRWHLISPLQGGHCMGA